MPEFQFMNVSQVVRQVVDGGMTLPEGFDYLDNLGYTMQEIEHVLSGAIKNLLAQKCDS
jgi:hypothetical protein